jgi:elongation factor P
MASASQSDHLLLSRSTDAEKSARIKDFKNLTTGNMGKIIVSKIGKGNVIDYNKEPCFVLERNIHTPPNLSSFCTMQLRNIRSGKAIHVRTHVGDSFEVLHKELKDMEYSYVSDDMHAFMDPETFEQVELDESIIGDAKPFLSLNRVYTIFFVEGVPMGVELPTTVELKVTEAPEAVRGDSSGNVQKTVVTETGLEVRTPIFIKTGEVIKVNTSDKSYQGRA